eukprot:CAMPEP_0194544606 /NCGR_PEP_ID=MMETSP0253-20130528/87852_1 /TAXON_ID=2966 /ORGANISM="Noctiluca scintillans" /LENGTH=80 /DNA_ID=CAMNT_0039391519 /DNA_START=87 /DNA_END=326 /DNA_ORIENTATION=-
MSDALGSSCQHGVVLDALLSAGLVGNSCVASALAAAGGTSNMTGRLSSTSLSSLSSETRARTPPLILEEAEAPQKPFMCV